jgi:uncharacterized protein YPO0396
MNLQQQIANLYKLRQQIAELKRAEQIATAEILSAKREELAETFNRSEYGTGTASLEVDGFKVKVVVTKKISYEQDRLATLREELVRMGEKPDEYIKVTYDVSEDAYKGWPSSLKKMFEPYRIVTPSKPALKIEA